MPGGPLKTLIKNALPERYHQPASRIAARLKGYRTESYSQCGEDFTLRWLFGNVEHGFFVDVGAYHPQKFSNTYYFYKRGWNGINVDPTPGVIELFKKMRPRDTSLAYAVAGKPGKLKLYMNRNEGAVNTLSPDFAALQSEQFGRQFNSEVVVEVHTLAEILDAYKLDERQIQFLSVDVEGLDLEVLKSNDWNKYVPRVILCEDIPLRDLESGPTSPTWAFLHDKGYSLLAKCVHTLVFAHSSYQPPD